jgi:hypothetical protein
MKSMKVLRVKYIRIILTEYSNQPSYHPYLPLAAQVEERPISYITVQTACLNFSTSCFAFSSPSSVKYNDFAL